MRKTKKTSYLGLKNWELKDEKNSKELSIYFFKGVILILLIKLQKFIMYPLIINHNNKNWKNFKFL